jgi:ferredoxin-NADP reductase/MOSC domain-containing protein YiiM
LPARLVSVNVGLPRDIAWRGQTVRTGIWKNPVAGRQRIRRLNIDGDGQGDLGGHGGLNRAVMVYQLDSYRYWESQLGRSNFVHGQFGENFTVEGLPDNEVCIGDRFRIGTALFEISQPRVTCYRVGIRMDHPQMASLLVAHQRPGFYFRVLEEGEIAGGDEIVKIADGPEHLTVAETDAMLYLHTHTPERLNRALRIPALAAGWQGSFRALLDQDASATPSAGNAGLAPATGPPPAWPGFRPLKISRIVQESASVRSFLLTSADDRPLVAALPGQFITVRLHPQPDGASVSRNYSVSGEPSAEHYRISVKLEPHGAASSYLHQHVREGDQLEVAAPRGNFILQSGDRPVVLLSAGVGATPVMSMLHALAAAGATREIWWLFGARNGDDHPFAAESRTLLQSLPHARSYIGYSRPAATDRLGAQFDAAGRLSGSVFEKVGLPRDADFYLCGPIAFTRELTAALEAWGARGGDIHSETFGPGDSITPGVVVAASRVPPHQPAGTTGAGPQVSFARSGLNVNWDEKYASVLELAEACDVPVRWACRTGVCHTCESALISGTVAYNPDPLDPPAPGNILICCARPQSELSLDL